MSKKFLKGVWEDKVLRYIILSIVILMIVFLILAAIDSSAEVFGTCVAKCKADVMYVHECIEDEQGYWGDSIPDAKLKNACIDLIRNERIDCYSLCAKKEVKNNYAVDYYYIHVKNFPDTNQ